MLQRITAAGFEMSSEVVSEAWINDLLGAILRKLEELGRDENTLVLE